MIINYEFNRKYNWKEEDLECTCTNKLYVKIKAKQQKSI